MNHETDANRNWEACPTGEIQGLGQSLRGQKHQQQLRKISMIGGVAVVVLAVGMLFGPQFQAPGEATSGRIACAEVKAHLSGYLNETLDKTLMTRIHEHMAHCERCRTKLENMRSEELQSNPSQVLVPRRTDPHLTAQLRKLAWSRSVALR